LYFPFNQPLTSDLGAVGVAIKFTKRLDVQSFGRYYQHSFETHPHVTLACANGALSSLGDFVAQVSQMVLQRRQRPHDPTLQYDLQRTARFLAFGISMGPVIGRWNKFLEFQFPLKSGKQQGVSMTALGKRVASDQLVMAPLGIVMFLGGMGVMEGRSREQIGEKYRDLYKPALLANWKVWPVAQLINFRYMPLPYRVPFSQTCGVFWTLYLSILNSREDRKQDAKVEYRKTLDF